MANQPTPAQLRVAADALQEAVTDRPDKVWRYKYCEPFFAASALLHPRIAGNIDDSTPSDALQILALIARDGIKDGSDTVEVGAGLHWLVQAVRLRLLVEEWDCATSKALSADLLATWLEEAQSASHGTTTHAGTVAISSPPDGRSCCPQGHTDVEPYGGFAMWCHRCRSAYQPR